MYRAIVRCLLLAAVLLAGGCLEFDAQDVTIRCDPEHDRIDVLLVYRGLYSRMSQDQPGDRVGKAMKDLDGVMQSGQFAFWCNWPFSIDLSGANSGPAAALLQHIEVENGGLFTDLKGTLCGYQFVRVNGAKAFLQKLNTLLEVRAQAMLAGSQEHKFDRETREQLRDFLRGGGRLLAVEPGRIELRIPCAAADHRWLKGQIEQYFLENAVAEMAHRESALRAAAAKGEEPGADIRPIHSVEIGGDKLHERLQQAASFRFFWDNDFAFERQADLTTITLGVKGDRELHIHKAADQAYGEDLKKALEARGDKFEAGVPDQELVRRFQAFGGRDAVLPAKLAAVRKK
jgi:hypothetical protein